ncbi:hypothetical protein OIU78_026698, partial [Salix suchowensis]
MPSSSATATVTTNVFEAGKYTTVLQKGNSHFLFSFMVTFSTILSTPSYCNILLLMGSLSLLL